MRAEAGRDRPPLSISIALVVTLLGVLAMVSSGYVALLLQRSTSLGSSDVIRTSLILGSTLLVLPGLLAVLTRGRPLVETLKLRLGGRRTLLLSAGLGLGLWVLSLGVLELQSAVWPLPPGFLERYRAIHAALRPSGPLDWLWSLIVIAVAPAICEELLVRGIDLPAFRTALGPVVAVAASAFIFALIHLEPYLLPFTFSAGLVLGTIRLRTGILIPSMIAHGLLNTLTFVVAPFMDDPTQPMPDPRPMLGAALFAGGLAVTFLLLRRLRGVDARPAPA